MEKKNPNDYPRVMFRVNKTLEPSLSERREGEQPLEQVVRRDLERYYELLKKSLPTFSINEAQLICNALNGNIIRPESVHLLWAEVSDMLEEGMVDERDVNGPALVKRLRALTPFECMSVADAVERVWNSPTYHADNFEERLRQSGLVKQEQLSRIQMVPCAFCGRDVPTEDEWKQVMNEGDVHEHLEDGRHFHTDCYQLYLIQKAGGTK
jgi:hypothetical protein